MGKVLVRDMAFGWCRECDAQIGDWPLANQWPASKSIWMHEHGTGHKVRRVSNDEAWSMVKEQSKVV